MRDLILIFIGLTSIGIIVKEDIKAYELGTYNPYVFRLRKDYESNVKYLLSNLGCFLPIIAIKNTKYQFLCFAVIFLIFCVSKSALNFICFKKNQKWRILIETVLFDIISIFLIATF